MSKNPVVVLAPVFYAGVSALLAILTSRLLVAYEYGTSFFELVFHPHELLFMRGEPFVLPLVLVLLGLSIRKRSSLLVFLVLSSLFIFTTLDVLEYCGHRPNKIDFRFTYLLETGVRLARYAALCSIASLILVFRKPANDLA